jgi:hypothetical protein
MDGDVGYGQAEADLGFSAKEVLNSAGHQVEFRLGVICFKDYFTYNT